MWEDGGVFFWRSFGRKGRARIWEDGRVLFWRSFGLERRCSNMGGWARGRNVAARAAPPAPPPPPGRWSFSGSLLRRHAARASCLTSPLLVPPLSPSSCVRLSFSGSRRSSAGWRRGSCSGCKSTAPPTEPTAQRAQRPAVHPLPTPLYRQAAPPALSWGVGEISSEHASARTLSRFSSSALFCRRRSSAAAAAAAAASLGAAGWRRPASASRRWRRTGCAWPPLLLPSSPCWARRRPRLPGRAQQRKQKKKQKTCPALCRLGAD